MNRHERRAYEAQAGREDSMSEREEIEVRARRICADRGYSPFHRFHESSPVRGEYRWTWELFVPLAREQIEQERKQRKGAPV
jgi:hypothetical protein